MKIPDKQMQAAMIDPFARQIDYLRVSVTDRCDFRCRYCMAENMTFLPKSAQLSLEELYRLCDAFIEMGVKKIRLTGGEPLVRRNVMWLFEQLGKHLATGKLDALTLTTNGSQLAKFAHDLYTVGVRRVNVSLDTLDRDKFRYITRGGDLDKVLTGLKIAGEAGLKIKINMVALKGINEDEIFDLVAWCGESGFDLTFIEVMPLGDLGGDLGGDFGNESRFSQYWPVSEVREKLSSKWHLVPSEYRTSGPARYYALSETGQTLGFITPLTHNFCESCNRVRLTSTGRLYLCLGQEDAVDLRPFLAQSLPDKQLQTEHNANCPLKHAIAAAIAKKPKGHDFAIQRNSRNVAVPRHMSLTGG